jgi:hypothetical protein
MAVYLTPCHTLRHARRVATVHHCLSGESRGVSPLSLTSRPGGQLCGFLRIAPE